MNIKFIAYEEVNNFEELEKDKNEIKEALNYLRKKVDKFEESKTYLIEKYNYKEQAIENMEQNKKYVYFKRLLDYIAKLQKYVDETFLYTYEELQDKVITLQFKVVEKQEKINKAIKHIETHQLCYQSQYEEISNFDNHLLDILKGSEE